MSEIFGTLFIITGSSERIAAGISATALFFAPLIFTVPFNLFPPLIIIFSIHPPAIIYLNYQAIATCPLYIFLC